MRQTLVRASLALPLLVVTSVMMSAGIARADSQDERYPAALPTPEPQAAAADVPAEPEPEPEVVAPAPAQRRLKLANVPLPPERPPELAAAPTPPPPAPTGFAALFASAPAAPARPPEPASVAADPPTPQQPTTAAGRQLQVASLDDGLSDGSIPMTAKASLAPANLRGLIARHAAANALPVALAEAVVRVESRFNPGARNGANLGLTQISYATARSLGYAGSPAGLLDAETNLRYGLMYLAQAYRLAKGETCRTILKYQAGHRAVTMTRAASAYCSRVKGHVAGLT